MNEPAAITALLGSDLTLLKQLSHKRGEIFQPGTLGFNTVELAHFLNIRQALEILVPHEHYAIWTIPRDSSKEISLNGTEFLKLFGAAYLPHLHFSDYRLLQRVVKSCPWLIRKSGFGEKIRAAGAACRDEILTGYVADVSIRWIDAIWGYGLFARSPFRKGTLIGSYTGEARPFSLFHPFNTTYVMQYPHLPWALRRFLIDASKAGNQLRFVNHSDQPNLIPIAAYDRGLLHILFLTNQPIESGAQLTFDYGKHYWRHRNQA